MLADGNNNQRLVPVEQLERNSERSLPVSLQNLDGVDFPLPPAMPEAVLLLRLLVSGGCADLHAITEVIRNDVGLAVQLLHMAARECVPRVANTLSIGETVVQVGLPNLRSLAAQ